MAIQSMQSNNLTAGLATATPAELAAASWLAGYPNKLTRNSYQMHLKAWFVFLAQYDIDPLAVQRTHIELWLRTLEGEGRAPRTVSLKLAAIRPRHTKLLLK